MTFEVLKGSSIRRTDIIDLCTQAHVHVVSVVRHGAVALEHQRSLQSELQQIRAETPDLIVPKVRKHPHTTATLQLLARLNEAITKIRRETSSADKQPAAVAAGDALMLDTMNVVDHHIALLKERGLGLPPTTDNQVVENFDWHGDAYATGARLVHSELIEFYRASFKKIARDAEQSAKHATDERAKAQYLALQKQGQSLEKVLEVLVLKRR